MSMTIERCEAARKLGAVILANEGRHGRPDQFHKVGDYNTEPKYLCHPHEYAIVATEETTETLGRAANIITQLAAMVDDDGMVETDLFSVRDLARKARELIEARV